jgi:hypothetical protein
MKFSMTVPCDSCPFRREGGVRLTPGRAREIAKLMMDSQGGTFACHKSVDYSEEDEDGDSILGPDDLHCAGALIFAEKTNSAGTQMMRISERFGDYDSRKFTETSKALIFDSLSEMLGAQSPRGRKAGKS